LMEKEGCQVTEADPPAPPKDQLEPGVWGYSGDHYAAAEGLAPGFWGDRAEELRDSARPIYEAGRRALAWQYRAMLGRNQAYIGQMRAWFEEHALQFVLTPAVAGAAL